jgi:hypothetical protein
MEAMELDDLKNAWRELDQRLQRQHDLQLQTFRQGKLDRMKSGLRPLFWGQIAQMAFGAIFIGLAALLWSTTPHAMSVIAAGVIVQAYGVACMLMAGVTLGRIGRIDYAAPVLTIQKQLAQVRHAHVLGGMIAGLPWWFLWLPVLMVLIGLAGGDLYRHAPAMVWGSLAVAAAGLLATLWFLRWSRNPSRPGLAQAVEDSLTGRSLRKAKAQLEELQSFEQE